MPLTLTRQMVTEQQTKWVYPRPITFDEWLEVSGPKELTELVDGVVEKDMVQLDHENRNRVRVLRRAEQGYEADDLTTGGLILTTLGGLSLEWNWLFI